MNHYELNQLNKAKKATGKYLVFSLSILMKDYEGQTTRFTSTVNPNPLGNINKLKQRLFGSIEGF